MKKTVLYIAAVLAVSGGLMWQRPMVAHAEPEVIQEAPVSTVLEVAAEEVADEDNGPAPEIQAAKKLEEELAAAEEAAARAAEEAASARQNLVDYALQHEPFFRFSGNPGSRSELQSDAAWRPAVLLRRFRHQSCSHVYRRRKDCARVYLCDRHQDFQMELPQSGEDCKHVLNRIAFSTHFQYNEAEER